MHGLLNLNYRWPWIKTLPSEQIMIEVRRELSASQIFHFSTFYINDEMQSSDSSPITIGLLR